MRRFDLLRSPVLLLAVGLLLLNDFVLKAAFHNWITGKLSDVAGLAAVAIFCCALWPKHAWRVGCAVTASFVWWKSPLSQPVLDVVNDLAPWHVGRTVDYSDLLALPAAWWACACASRPRLLPVGRVWVWSVAGLYLFVFGASMLYPTGYGSWHKAYLRADGTTEADRTIAVSRLEPEIDDVATKHGWTGACRQPPCPGLLAGRTYTGRMQSVAVIYDAERKGLRFTLSAADPKEVEQIKEEIGRAVKERLHGWTVGEWTDPTKTYRSLRLHIASRSAEVDRAIAVVTQVFRAEGLSEPVQPAMDAGQKAVWGHKTYSAGPPVDGPSRAQAIVADWSVQDDRQQWRLVVNVGAGAPEHVERQTQIVEALRQALAREFGADSVY